MKKKILLFVAASALISATIATAQSTRTFAVTSDTKGTFSWNVIREIDLSSGEVLSTFYNPAVNKSVEISNTENAKLASANDRVSDANLLPLGQGGVAAVAFDAKHNRLYYTCMRGTDLRYFDLNGSSQKVVYNQSQPLYAGNRFDEANVITRMAFASDGFGYAITNDGKNLIRFTTDQKPAITNLGELIDGKKNGSISVHNQCSSWGGDMVGDVYGNLYLISMRNNLFKINPQTRIADFVGQVQGLPANFTSNGMVVNDEGELVISSAAVSGNYYKVNISTLQAAIIKNATGNVYNSSDLANANLLYQNNKVANSFAGEVLGNRSVSIYPNPIANKTFSVLFDKVDEGVYNLLLTDAAGRTVVEKSLSINVNGQTEKITLPKTAAGGVYLLKLVGSSSAKVMYNNKIVVQ